MIGKIRRLHRQKKSVREIARITSLSRNTVRKWLNVEVGGSQSTAALAATEADAVPRGAGAGAQRGRTAAEA